MTEKKARPTVEEIYALLKKSELPTVLVEGKDDIIFYRAIEHELRKLEVDMLPAGNKHAVLELRKKIKENPIMAPTVFIVDKDLWVYPGVACPKDVEDVILTSGYSIENDLFVDGGLEFLLSHDEVSKFRTELSKFVRWYALSITRNLNGSASEFRTNPGKVLDDKEFYDIETTLREGEYYPEVFFTEITSNYSHFLRGKSLFALLLRQLSAPKRDVKFGGKQLMWIGARKKGDNFVRIQLAVQSAFEQFQNNPVVS
ncbi:DUF4435 domain-containing protein [Janthinobacterium lividum]|uniref:DUF4435 domain-containing protein n=1 Tax=Janthinobacterium lividum TaxID=29581 RepID=UPI0009B873A2|nr:DUF4435 domain-containing protein [Janthinobacterium lividum]